MIIKKLCFKNIGAGVFHASTQFTWPYYICFYKNNLEHNLDIKCYIYSIMFLIKKVLKFIQQETKQCHVIISYSIVYKGKHFGKIIMNLCNVNICIFIK